MSWALDMVAGVECEEDAPAAEGEINEERGRLGRAQKDAAGRAMTSRVVQLNLFGMVTCRWPIQDKASRWTC